MLKLQYPICCGVDVHKNLIVATDSKGISEYEQKSFSTINSDIQKFHNWLIKNNCYHVCMESTGKYWIPIFNYLETHIDVCRTHPKYVKAIKGKKQIRKILAGLLTFINLTWSEVPLFLRKTFGNSVNWLVIVLNLSV